MALPPLQEAFSFEDDDNVIANVSEVRVCVSDKGLNLTLNFFACFPSIHCDGSPDFERGK